MEKYSVENVLIAVLGFPCIFYLILIGLGYWAGIDVVNTAMFLYFKVFITVFLFSVAVKTIRCVVRQLRKQSGCRRGGEAET